MLIQKLSIIIGRISFFIAQIFRKNGTAFPGKIALKFSPDLLAKVSDKCDTIVFITGTNGKTTINNLSSHVLNGEFKDVLSNLNGSNMIQGVLTPFITDYKNHYDVGIFEVDEGSVPVVTNYITPDYLILTNFFRDQLDRYGEVEITINSVKDSISPETILIINSDNPSLLYFDDLPNKKVYYGFSKTEFIKNDIKVLESIFCPRCGNKLSYDYVYYGNVGKYYCNCCGASNPESNYLLSNVDLINGFYEFTVKSRFGDEKYILNLMGLYNLYNSLGVISLAKELNMSHNIIKERIMNFKRIFGRMEIFHYSHKDLILVLSKNPVGLSEVFNSILHDLDKKSILFILNDYSPDGRDISWIWDADFDEINNISNLENFYCGGTRGEDLALRLKYAGVDEKIIKIRPCKDQFHIDEVVNEILNENFKSFVIGTFTAIPEVRKILLKKEKEGF